MLFWNEKHAKVFYRRRSVEIWSENMRVSSVRYDGVLSVMHLQTSVRTLTLKLWANGDHRWEVQHGYTLNHRTLISLGLNVFVVGNKYMIVLVILCAYWWWYVNKDIDIWYVYLMSFINKSKSSVVESSTHYKWIGGSNTSGNYWQFRISSRMNSFSSKNCPSRPLKISNHRSGQWHKTEKKELLSCESCI